MTSNVFGGTLNPTLLLLLLIRDVDANASGQTRIVASEMWTWRRMERISWMDKFTSGCAEES